jgi:hypothetical protein
VMDLVWDRHNNVAGLNALNFDSDCSDARNYL